jgi:hypothetical protein
MRHRSATDIQTKLKRKRFSKQNHLLPIEKTNSRVTNGAVILSEAKHP